MHVRFVLTCVVVLVALSVGSPAHAAGGKGCTQAELEIGVCHITTNNGKSVDIESAKTVGEVIKDHRRETQRINDTNPGETIYTPVVDLRTRDEKFADCNTLWGLMNRCVPPIERPADQPAPKDPRATQPITITDLASFSPAPGTLAGEPDNLGVAGLPTNFTTNAAAHTRSGTLFGYPVTARFTPATFVFRYGDGQTRTTTTAGKTWEALRVPQFTPTDTSHTYAERGAYQASVDTVYTAEIDLGTGYFPISGTLTIPGPPQSIQIYEARTALVAHTCDEDPAAEGCPAS